MLLLNSNGDDGTGTAERSTGIGDTTRNTVDIDYAAIVTPLSDSVTNATVANVVFVIEWDTAA